MAFGTVATPAKTTGAADIGRTNWTDKGEVAQAIKAIWEGRGNDAKRRAEAQAWRNISFFCGDQWHTWDNDKRTMQPDANDLTGSRPRPNWEVRLQYNHIESMIEARTAKLQRNNIEWDIVPVSTDRSDEMKARTQRQVMDYQWDKLKMQRHMYRLMLWLQTAKTAFFDIYWNPKAGDDATASIEQFIPQGMPMGGGIDPLMMARQQMAQMYGEQAAQQGYWQGKTGDVCVELAPIFEINVWPFNVLNFDDATVWVRTYEKTVAEAAEELGVDEETVRGWQKDDDAKDFYRNQPVKSSWQDRWHTTSANEDNDSVLIHKFYHKKCAKYPKGVFGFVCGNETVVLMDNPYRDAQIPIIAVQERWTPNNLWGRCTVDALVDPQRDFNLAASQESNARNFQIFPTITRIQGDQLSDDDFCAAPGKVNEVPSANHIPQILVMPDPGQVYQNTMTRDLSLMRELSAVGQIDYGTAEGGNPKSGRGILALQEQNDARLLPFGQNLNRCVQETAEVVLNMLQDFLSDQRTVQIVGKDNQLEVLTFSGNDIRPSNYGQPGARTAMVKVSSYSQLPSTRAEMRQTLDSFIDRGILNPLNPEHASMIFQMWGLGDDQKLIDASRKHFAKQAAEIEAWKRGEEVPLPSQTDNHMVHRQVLSDWMNTNEYREVIAANPIVGQIISQHLDLHRQSEVDEMVRPQYYAFLANWRLWAEFQQKIIAMGLPPQIMPMPLPMMQAAAEQQKEDGGQPGEPGAATPPGEKSSNKSVDKNNS